MESESFPEPEDPVTVMLDEAVFPWSTVVAVMVAVPWAKPVTSPEVFTDATEAFDDDQVTD